MAMDGLSIPIRLSYQGGTRWERRHPVGVAWRVLPHSLICIPDGGNWELELHGHTSATVHSDEVMLISRGV